MRITEIVLCFLALLASMPVYADLCSDIDSIYEASQNGFSAWKGHYDSDMSEYESKYNLQSASRCFIELDGTTKDYTCEWYIGTKDMMYANYNAFVQQIAACPINGIKSSFRKKSFPNSETDRISISDKETSYYDYNGDIKLSASIRSVFSKKNGTYQNIIDFKLENWQ
jgi:hypothetical protein